jgi:hypothetical protein
MTFTEKQLQDFAAYEAVQRSGEINMWDANNGCRLSGLTRDEYLFVLSNYTALREQRESKPRINLYERTRAAVYATGNKWAIENFNATHN